MSALATSSMSNGSSGISTIVAPPAMPAHVAMWPAWRPMTSTTMTRSWDSAVVCSRSIASTQICTAVSKPNVSSVAFRSLSIVFGTPTTFTPSSWSLAATPSVSSPPMATSASMPSAARVSRQRSTPPSILNGLVRDDPRIVPPRGSVPRIAWMSRRTGAALDHALPAVEEPDDLVVPCVVALADDRPHDGVQPRAVTSTREHPDAHGAKLCQAGVVGVSRTTTL